MGQIQEYLAGSIIVSILAMSIFMFIVVVFAAVVIDAVMDTWYWLFGAEEED